VRYNLTTKDSPVSGVILSCATVIDSDAELEFTVTDPCGGYGIDASSGLAPFSPIDAHHNTVPLATLVVVMLNDIVLPSATDDALGVTAYVAGATVVVGAVVVVVLVVVGAAVVVVLVLVVVVVGAIVVVGATVVVLVLVVVGAAVVVLVVLVLVVVVGGGAGVVVVVVGAAVVVLVVVVGAAVVVVVVLGVGTTVSVSNVADKLNCTLPTE
jgi:hypothetical protein